MIFDLVVLAALLISCLIAFLRGFIREVLTILGVIGGALAAIALGPKLSPVMFRWLSHGRHAAASQANATHAAAHGDKVLGVLSPEIAADLIAYGGVFVLVVIILSIVSHLLSGAAKKIGLGAVDRTFGVFFGIARALLLLSLVYIPIFLMTDEPTRIQWFGDSHARPYIQSMAIALESEMPKSMAKDLNAVADKDSAKMAGSTREKLEQLNLLGQRFKTDARAAGDKTKHNGAQVGETLRNKAEDMRDAIHQGGKTLREDWRRDDEKAKQDVLDANGYDTRQRGQMNGLIQQENQTPSRQGNSQ